ncbi:MAG: histidine kinase [Candidatus Nanopelagicales bacterium]|nr:histidine kinase [Candidatus Nanopelagicales bacterium]
MRWPTVPHIGEQNLAFEWLLGRLAMIATLAVFVSREAPGFRLLDNPSKVRLGLAIVVFIVTWAWFWLKLAAGPETAWHATAVVLMVASATVLVLDRPIGLFPFYYAVIVAGAAFRWRIGAALAAGTLALATCVWWFSGMAAAWSLQSVAVTALLGGAAVVVRRYVGVRLELQQTKEELQRLAAADARAKLGRDLHDQLGQNLTTTVMQGELLLMDLPPGCDENVVQRAQLLVSTAREGLVLMREMVTELRARGANVEAALGRQLLESCGIVCSFQLPTDPLPGETDAAFGWVLREAVTNVVRHSGATECTVTIREDGGGCDLRVSDNGRGAVSAAQGNGLTHMRERLDLAGGTLSVITSTTGGFVLTASVPAAAAAGVEVAP